MVMMLRCSGQCENPGPSTSVAERMPPRENRAERAALREPTEQGRHRTAVEDLADSSGYERRDRQYGYLVWIVVVRGKWQRVRHDNLADLAGGQPARRGVGQDWVGGCD